MFGSLNKTTTFVLSSIINHLKIKIMKKLVISFSVALFTKLAVIPFLSQTPFFTPLPASLYGWVYDLNVLTIFVFTFTIPIITYKLIKNKLV
jgi:hypothetical protein